MSRVPASALILAGVLVSAASCGESAVPLGTAGAAGRDVHAGERGDSGEAGAGATLASDAGAGARNDDGGEGGANPVKSSGGSSGRRPHTTPETQGGEGGGAAASSDGTGGDSTQHGGTSGASASSGGVQNMAGGAQGGTGARAGSGGATAGTAGAGGVSNQLSVCLRLSDATTSALQVTTDFEHAFITNCNISWVFYLYYDASKGLYERDTFLNQVDAFDFELWGCADAPPPTSFDLIYTPEPLTLADAGALIDAYMGAASSDLSLSPGEAADMRAALVRLSQPLLVSPDPGGFSQSHCQGGAGGQTGSGGLGGSSGGAGTIGGSSGAGGLGAAGQGGAGPDDTGGGGAG